MLPAVVEPESIEAVRERLRRSIMGLRDVGLGIGVSSSLSDEEYWESGIMVRGSSRSSETECWTSANVIGFLVRLSEGAVRRRWGGGRFSFSWESVGLRLSGLTGAAAESPVCESGIEISVESLPSLS